jgi:RecA/RadA recombinase
MPKEKTTKRKTTKKVTEKTKAAKRKEALAKLKKTSWYEAQKKANKKTSMKNIVQSKRKGCVNDALSTGAIALDLALGGGWAPGKVGSLVGPEMSGKSTLLFKTLIEAMKSEIPVNFYDAEGSLDRTYLENQAFNCV